MAESHRDEIAKLEALYAGNPGGRVFVHLAEAYRKAGEHERARRILDDGLSRHADSASGYVVLGRVLADMQITDEARSAFLRVLELDGGNLVALRWLGDIARQSGRYAEAASYYRELLTRNPSNEEVRDLVEIVEREGTAEPEPAAVTEADDEIVPDEADFVGIEDAETAAPVYETDVYRDYAEHAAEAPVGAAEDVETPSPFNYEETVAPPVEFAASAEPDQSSADEPFFAPFVEPPAESEAEPEFAGDGPVVEGLLEAEEFSTEAFESLGVELLEPGLATDAGDADADDLAVEIDLTDLAEATGDELEAEYAGEEFLADFMAEPSRPGGFVDEEDVLDSDSPLTLLGDDAAAAAGAGSPDPLEEPDDYFSEPLELMDADGVEEPGDSDEYASFEVVESFVAASMDVEEPDDVVDSLDIIGSFGAAEADVPVEPAAPEPVVPTAPVAREAAPVTETMALLYRSQGFHDRAAEVYRALLRQRPGDDRLAARLREAEEAAGMASTPPAPVEEEAGEVWLRGVGAAWTADAADSADATPYAWTETSDEAERGEPIGTYLQDLVSWKQGHPRWVETAMLELEAVDEVDAPASESWTAPAESAPGGAAGQAGFAMDPWAAAADEPTSSWEPSDIVDDAPVLEMDELATPQAEEPVTANVSAGPADVAPPADDGSDDEDLETFRSWLQSLKK